jgi:hypothetical protein
MTNKSQQLNWLEKEVNKDKKELDLQKQQFIQQIKNIKKEDIFKESKPKKLNIWQRIKKVLMG